MAAALGGNGITLLTSRGFSCWPPSLFVNNTPGTRRSYPPNSSATKPHPHPVASLSTTSTSYSSSSSVNPPPSTSSSTSNEGIIRDEEGGGSPGEGIQQQERLSDYLQLSKELVVRSKDDGGPPRWFSYYPIGAPGPDPRPAPLLLYLPGAGGVGSGLLLQMDELSGMFEVRCLHIPILDRTPFPELVKLVEETVRWEASRSRRGRASSSTAPIYLVGESFGGCLALAVASRNPHLHLILILANPATGFTKSFLPAFSQILLPDDDHRTNLGLLYVLSLASGFPWRFAMDALRKGLTPQQTFADLAECSAALSSYLSVLAELLTPETLNWKLKMLKSAAEFANSRLHAVKARTLILSSGRDPLIPSQEEGERLRRMLPNCEIRMFSNGGHALFLEDGFVLATVIKGASFYQRGRQLDYVSDYLPPKHSEFNRLYEPYRWMEVACNPVMLSTLENGKMVRGLGGIPCEGPVLFVGDHMMLGLEIIPLVAGFWKEKGIVLRGIAHPLAFRKLKDGKLPDLSTFDALRFMGAVPVSATNLYKLLSSKAHVLLYPGGMREALHRKGEEHKLIWPEQSEFVRMAARFGAKIVPFGAVGEDDFGQKMPITMKTPFMPKTEDQRRRLRLLENSLDTIKLEASVRTDDLDRVVDHIVRVNVVIQQCIWHGGFRLGRDDKAAYGKLASSFKNKFLKELAVRSWRDPEGSFHQALRRFFKMFFSLGVRRTRDHEDLLKLRRDRCAARVIEGEVIYSFPADLEWKVKESLPVRKYFK